VRNRSCCPVSEASGATSDVEKPSSLDVHWPNDKTRINSADFMEKELRDEVRRLTRFSQEDTIAMTSAQSPYGLRHLPSEVIT
jgi:hypothetical protein